MRAGMDDDLNTAMPQVRFLTWCAKPTFWPIAANSARATKAPLLEALQQFDEIFAVLKDDDAEKMKAAMEWGGPVASLKTRRFPADAMSDAEINRLIEERNAAKKARDFGRSDAIRKQLSDAGIIVEDTKDGSRWKRK